MEHQQRWSTNSNGIIVGADSVAVVTSRIPGLGGSSRSCEASLAKDVRRSDGMAASNKQQQQRSVYVLRS
ncbi:hypothetical protein NL676_012366 [Syzygium grande]|nr:hypothetical protein NL676_012366 [Syzygium grande]